MSPLSPADAALVLTAAVGLTVLAMAHVAVSPKSGPWRPPPGSRCPFGPRTGWLMIVLIAGPLGWMLYMRGRGKRPPPPIS